MWDVLSQDYDKNISPEKCLSNVLGNVRPGSIVVFHDSLKAKDNLYFALPAILEKLSRKYQFLSIEEADSEAVNAETAVDAGLAY